MPVETPSLFAQVIRDHLELKERNSDLDPRMPIERYKSADPFENHPLFKTEEQARLEETMDGVDPDFVAHSAERPCPGPARRPRRPRRRPAPCTRCPQARSRTPASGPSIAHATSTGATICVRPSGATLRTVRCLAPLYSTAATSRRSSTKAGHFAPRATRRPAGAGSRSGGSSRSRARRAPTRASGRAPS